MTTGSAESRSSATTTSAAKSPRAKYVVSLLSGQSVYADWRRYRKRALALQRAQALSEHAGRVVVWDERSRDWGGFSREATATFDGGRCIFDRETA